MTSRAALPARRGLSRRTEARAERTLAVARFIHPLAWVWGVLLSPHPCLPGEGWGLGQSPDFLGGYMRVLVACEYSGKVREAFRRKGHFAWSCDLLPSDDGSDFHIQGDCIPVIKQGWDLIIMHPPCTALAVSGNRWYGEGMPKHQERLESIEWTLGLFELAKKHSPRVAMENPVGVLPIKPSQYVQPWQFGHGETKKTGLWLHGLPLLKPTQVVDGREQRIWKLPPSVDRWKIRSETFQGIADAMADQWSHFSLAPAQFELFPHQTPVQ